MEKVLILAYYYPPCKGVSAYRPQSWAKDFHKFGLHPTIVTRKWTGKENVWGDYMEEVSGEVEIVEHPTSKVAYLPYKQNPQLKFAQKKWVKNLFIDKFIFLYLALSGKFQPEIDAYNCFNDFLRNHLEKEKYKLIIVTCPPINAVRLAYELEKKFKIPFVIDFQDSWNNLLLGENYRPSFKEKIYDALREIYMRKWLKRSLFNITVTPSIGDLIKKINDKPVSIITNGFDPEVYTSIKTEASAQVFNISIMGTIHPIQDISEMIAGLKLFLKDCEEKKVKINFIGVDAFPEVSKHIRASLPTKFIHISPRVSMDEAAELTLAANILLFPSYKGYKGYYTAKIFEYLGAKRNILMIPGNKDIVDDLILKTNSGKIANSAEEFKQILEQWHKEWKETGAIKYHGIKEEINYFSREHQNKLFFETIKKHIR